MSVKRPDPTDVYVGNRIRALRMERGYSQTDLANCLGVTFQQVQKYEKGANRIGAGRLTQIARFLEIDVVTMFAGAPGDAPAQPVGDFVRNLSATRIGLRLARAFASIDDVYQREAIVMMAEACARLANANAQRAA